MVPEGERDRIGAGRRQRALSQLIEAILDMRDGMIVPIGLGVVGDKLAEGCAVDIAEAEPRILEKEVVVKASVGFVLSSVNVTSKASAAVPAVSTACRCNVYVPSTSSLP